MLLLIDNHDDSPDIAQRHRVLLDARRTGGPAPPARCVQAHITDTAETAARPGA
jgi:hypothetical protein